MRLMSKVWDILCTLWIIRGLGTPQLSWSLFLDYIGLLDVEKPNTYWYVSVRKYRSILIIVVDNMLAGCSSFQSLFSLL